MYPFDTISTKIKQHSAEFLSFRQGYQAVISKGGFKSLFRGITTTFPCSFIPQVIMFSTYETLNKIGLNQIQRIKNENTQTTLKIAMPLLTSSVAELLCVIPYIPFDVIRARMQINDPNFQYKSIFHGIREISRKEGLIRLFKASPIYMLTITTQVSLLFWMYELQRYLFLHNTVSKTHDGKHTLSFYQSLFVGLTSSIFATIAVNPLDLILTRYQVIDSNKQMLSAKKIVKDLVREEGYKGFFKGLTPRLMISGSYSLLFMPIYEHFKSRYGVDISQNS